ncbi:hypothetical protein SUGI_0565800 [Cryptomeria japonica]|nr:hypothetical protein SUGI_0565800 [Cryptomeria japonica]
MEAKYLVNYCILVIYSTEAISAIKSSKNSNAEKSSKRKALIYSVFDAFESQFSVRSDVLRFKNEIIKDRRPYFAEDDSFMNIKYGAPPDNPAVQTNGDIQRISPLPSR